MNKVTGEQATKSVAEAYANMVFETKTHLDNAAAAADQAKQASSDVQKTGKKEDHEIAYHRHMIAAKSYDKAFDNVTDSQTRRELEKKAAHHYSQAQHHRFEAND